MSKGRLFKGALFAGLLYGAVVVVELPPTTVQPSSAPPQKQSLKVGQKVTLKAFHRLGSTTYDAEIGRLLTSHASVVVMSSAEFAANFGKFGVSTASRVALIPVDSEADIGHMAAEGCIDISDEELAALIMEILDA